MTKGWTDERRRKQAETIKQWKPWEKSTGPRTQEGKDKTRLNALKHGQYSLEALGSLEGRAIRAALDANRDFLKYVELWCGGSLDLNGLMKTLEKTRD